MGGKGEHNIALVMNMANGQSHIRGLLDIAIQTKASDFHINVGLPPVMRINTELIKMEAEPVTAEKAKDMLFGMIGPEKFEIFEQKRDYDFSITGSNESRFRVNARYQRDSIALSFRLITSHIPRLDGLHLPEN